MARIVGFSLVWTILVGTAMGDEMLSAVSSSGTVVSLVVTRPVQREVVDHTDVDSVAEATETATIVASCAGLVIKSYFQSGAAVRKGDVLFEVDTSQEATALVKAASDLRALDSPASPYSTYGYASQTLESATGSRNAAATALEAARAKLEAVRSDAIRAPQNNTKIVARTSGQLGQIKIDADGCVNAGATLATIEAIDSLRINLKLDELSVLKLRGMHENSNHARSVTLQGASIACSMAGEEGFPRQAFIESFENRIENHNFNAVARIDNAQHLLTPGMAARVRLTVSKPRKAIVIPADAVYVLVQDANGTSLCSSPDHAFVYTVNEKHFTEFRRVAGDFMQLDDGSVFVTRDGLTTKDLVVASGQGVVAAGMKLK